VQPAWGVREGQLRARWRGRQPNHRRRRRQPVVVGGKCTRAHHPAAALRPRRVFYGSYIDARCGRASAVTPRPRPPRRRARRKRRASSLNVHGRPYAQVPILQPNVCNGVVNAAIRAPMSSTPVSPPPAHCRSRRRSRAAEPASPAGGGGTGGDRWGGLVAPPLEQLARVHAVDGSRLIRTEVQLFPSNPRGVSSLRKRMRGGGAPVTFAWLPSNPHNTVFVPFINGFIPLFKSTPAPGRGRGH